MGEAIKCYHCGSDIRPQTIICPVCNRMQHLSMSERMLEYFREQWGQRVVTNSRSASWNK